jgi:hypothetical protein
MWLSLYVSKYIKYILNVVNIIILLLYHSLMNLINFPQSMIDLHENQAH